MCNQLPGGIPPETTYGPFPAAIAILLCLILGLCICAGFYLICQKLFPCCSDPDRTGTSNTSPNQLIFVDNITIHQYQPPSKDKPPAYETLFNFSLPPPSYEAATERS
ncbi:unnamed protein product [Darwinula stevensoni]|uniref:Uncharacterized protein n=1 Tax=Darwinula stevensoni TaxID=69355 RepID=A0A7R8X099_9CRUS|nr:unnamed protein product [Darwinula stevensoni]CAG0878646.1 unnamed protein product [Darwinula stevensoni]